MMEWLENRLEGEAARLRCGELIAVIRYTGEGESCFWYVNKVADSVTVADGVSDNVDSAKYHIKRVLREISHRYPCCRQQLKTADLIKAGSRPPGVPKKK